MSVASNASAPRRAEDCPPYLCSFGLAGERVLKPKLAAEISFIEWTNYCLLRHATFEGLRDDKEPRSVVREVAAG
jgi:ATP-dependent DNA ligase